MSNQGNALRIANTDGRKSVPHQDAREPGQGFSFQAFSQHADEEAPRDISSRRAVLDKRLLEEIYECIAQQDDLETAHLQLHAHDGIVSIEGSVADSAMRARIGKLVRRCSVAKRVINRLQTRDARPGHEELQIIWQARWRIANASGSNADRARRGAIAA